MSTTFIVSFIGQATPTTIQNLAAITHENDGKWLVSKVNFLENHVSAVIKVELPSENQEVVKRAFQDYPNLTVQITDTDPHIHDQETIYHLRLDANDRSGIVNEITQYLDAQDIRILDMDCHRVFLAGGGGISSSLFTANIALKIPQAMKISDIANELEALSEDTRVIMES
ncbi:transcriptional regulator [Vibrio sp. 10N.286.49.C2]|uniref:glycine cleavage system protein R n=1 Tax=unclassified Vibrio TaxID=2614977 RepID=UPI000C81DF61|nr:MULTISPECIES: ACT domain-containing protein [unclassified Vibrio]PMH40762.1 transcriptional regulator [Vibrio sp. 10N.286.49.C2]PMH45297.1 transcriptional regulator [Vibrio sp. 10N.286.49.B1]PMH78941.1 transcriptional regulator [Vibrio sp. 10N.286.48.B7]